MGKITLREKILYAKAHGEPLSLKGHTKLILEDIRDGSQKVVECDNMITNAVSSILANNWEANTNFNSIMPLRHMFGGVMCFQDEIEEDADNFMPPNDLVNPLVAHAGDSANNTGSLLRGSPVTSDFEITDTSIKQVWLWDNTQGNGTIRTVCLCSGKMGNMGLKPFNDEFCPIEGVAQSFDAATILYTADKESFYKYPISISDDGKTGKAIWISGTTFTETTVRHDWLAHGIMRTKTDWQKVSERTATIRTFDLNKSSVFEDDTHYWIYEITSSTSLKIDKVAKSNMAVTQADITFSGISMYTGNIGNTSRPINIAFPRFAYDGTYLYLPNASANGFIAVNPSDNSDVFALDGTLNIATGIYSYDMSTYGMQNMRPIVMNDGLIVGNNYIINGRTAYQTKETKNVNLQENYFGGNCIMDTIRRGSSLYTVNHQWYSTNRDIWFGTALNHIALASINVLPEAKTKSTSQTMRVIYTLTEDT